MQTLLIDDTDGVVTFTLNRPDKANALDAMLVERLHDALDSLLADARILVLRGAGRNFCAGFDFTGFEESTIGDLAWRFVRIEQLLQRITHAACKTIALAQGGCFGAGADMLIACEKRFAAPDTRFRMPGWHFGLALGTRRLSACVGNEIARRMLEVAEVVTAVEAAANGMIDADVAPAGWPELINSAARVNGAISREARARLKALTVADTRAADMHALVESLAAGDLKVRIRAFRALSSQSARLTAKR